MRQAYRTTSKMINSDPPTPLAVAGARPIAHIVFPRAQWQLGLSAAEI